MLGCATALTLRGPPALSHRERRPSVDHSADPPPLVDQHPVHTVRCLIGCDCVLVLRVEQAPPLISAEVQAHTLSPEEPMDGDGYPPRRSVCTTSGTTERSSTS